MAQTVINSYSDPLEDIYASGGSPTNFLTPFEGAGRVKRIHFTVTLASQASGEDIAAAVIPAGCYISGGEIWASGTLANSAQLSVGLAGKDGSGYIDKANSVSDNVAYLKAAAVLGTTRLPIAATPALGFGYNAEKDLWLTLTTSVGTVATEVISGYVDIVID